MLHEDNEVVTIIAKLLGLDSEQFKLKEVLILRQINVRGNVTEIPLRVHEVSYLARPSFLIFLYLIIKLYKYLGPRKQTRNGTCFILSDFFLVIESH